MRKSSTTSSGKNLKVMPKTKMVCYECDAEFSKKIGAKTFEVKCPKCGGYDTDVGGSPPYEYGEDYGGAFDGSRVTSDADSGL